MLAHSIDRWILEHTASRDSPKTHNYVVANLFLPFVCIDTSYVCMFVFLDAGYPEANIDKPQLQLLAKNKTGIQLTLKLGIC